jgi:hypothetical protein
MEIVFELHCSRNSLLYWIPAAFSSFSPFVAGMYTINKISPTPHHCKSIVDRWQIAYKLSVQIKNKSATQNVTNTVGCNRGICHGPSDPEKVLQLHHRDHLDCLHCLMWEFHRSLTTKHYKGWCGQPSTSLGPSSLPSRISISGGVRAKPQKLPKTPATQAIDCSLCYHPANGRDSFYPEAIRLLK